MEVGSVTGWVEPELDGVALSSIGWTVTAQDIPRARARTAAVDVPGADGYADATARPGGYPRLEPLEGSLTLVCLGGDECEVEVALSALWSRAGREAWYTPWDRGGLRYRCLWSPSVVERGCLRAEVDVAVTLQPAAYGAAMSRALAAGAAAVRVGGTWPTAPTVSLVASGGPLRVDLGGGGEFVQLLADPPAGARVELDFGTMEARVGGEAARVTLQSTWGRLAPGDRRVAVAGGSGSLAYVERWI